MRGDYYYYITNSRPAKPTMNISAAAYINSFGGYGYPGGWYGGCLSRGLMRNFYRVYGVSDSGAPSGGYGYWY